MSFAQWLNTRLTSRDVDGTFGSPGYGLAQRWEQENGSTVTLISRGVAYDVYVGKRVITNFSVDSRVMLAIAKWVLKLWVLRTWFGFKTWLWQVTFLQIMGKSNGLK